MGEAIEDLAAVMKRLRLRGSDCRREQEESTEDFTPCPPWLVEPCRYVVLFDLGLRMKRLDFRYVLEPIHM